MSTALHPLPRPIRTMTTEIGIQVAFPRDDERIKDQWDVANVPQAQRVPPPKYRHAAPSAPWPWMDLNYDDANVMPLTPGTYEPWSRYPQSHFGNWTEEQVRRCRMLTICKDEYTCKIHRVDVLKDGTFERLEEEAQTWSIPRDDTSARQFWDDLHKPVEKLRVRALFIDNITSDVLRILGARYIIEPFFFASSANWIPSRYQENPHDGEGDHITVILPFIRRVKNQRPLISSQPPPEKGAEAFTDKLQTIDTQAPLILSDQNILLQDLLAIHMVRHRTDNTIISYHHHSDLQKTTAPRLRSLVQRTGDSVYWQKLYEKSKDPTFLFLAILWYALYAWDEALETLYAHLSEQLEAKTTSVKTSASHTRELHKLQAHLLYYQQLLRDFKKSVEFVRGTPNPAMFDQSISDSERDDSQKTLKLESENLLGEIQRLERQRQVQSSRLENATALAFSTVNIEDSNTMKTLTKASLRDSAAIKLLSYLTMIFLPANYLSSVFGMNVKEIGGDTNHYHVVVYIECTIVLTLVTAWVIVAVQSHSSFLSSSPGERHIVRRIAWPVFYAYERSIKMVDAVQEWRRRRSDVGIIGY